jgi:hypothetical protein
MHYSGYRVTVRRTGSLYLQTCCLIFLLRQMLLHEVPHAFPICLRCLWLLVLCVLKQCSCVELLWWGELREKRPPRSSFGSSLCSSPFACLQPRYDAGRGFSHSTRVQLQQQEDARIRFLVRVLCNLIRFPSTARQYVPLFSKKK